MLERMEGSKRRLAANAVRSVTGAVHLPLLDAIAATPHDPEPWAVYADLLQTEDHPRGELISLMLERERRPSSRLFEIQRKQLAVLSEPAIVVGWRRGFASELSLDDADQLAIVERDPSLRFVESATLVIDSWEEWSTALAAVKLPWRRLCVQLVGGDTIEVAPILACCPALTMLRIAFDEAAEVVFDDARAEQLTVLALVNAGEIGSLDDAELPRLVELRLLGETTASDKLVHGHVWSRLSRVLVAEALDDVTAGGPQVHVVAALAERAADEDDDDEQEPLSTAFVVVGRPIEAELVKRLAARLSIAHLSARIAQLQGVTVLQLFGPPDAELMPYGLAVALRNVLDGTPPIALVEVDGDRAARYLVLDEVEVRATQQGRPEDTVRRAFDLVLGCDPGTLVLADVLAELAMTPVERLLGNGATDQLAMIDPSTAPLVSSEENGAADDDEEYDEEDEYGYGEYDDDDGLEASYEEPPLVIVARPVSVEPSVATAETVEVAESDDDLYDEPLVIEVEDVEDALVAPPDQPEYWFDFREHWDDRAIAVDDEEGEARWPDPGRDLDEPDIDDLVLVAEPACARHERALDLCTSCSDAHCVECGGEDYCATCFAVLVETTVRAPGVVPSP